MSKLPRIGSDMSLTEQAYLAIKEAIIKNDLQPNETLTEEGLAFQLGISRTPIRAALEKLAYQRLVVMKKGRNAAVARFTKKDLEKVFDIRLALDPLIARKVTVNFSTKKGQILEANLREQSEAMEGQDFDLYIKKDYDFHVTLAKFAENELLYDIIVNVSTQVMRFLILSTSLEKSSSTALEEHRAILHALRKGDPELAEKEARVHVLRVMDRFL